MSSGGGIHTFVDKKLVSEIYTSQSTHLLMYSKIACVTDMDTTHES